MGILRMPRYTCALFLAIIVVTLAPHARAQTCDANAQSPIATDRPQITGSSIVVPCGSLQFENGFQETGNGGQQTLDFPETSVRLGLPAKPSFVLESRTTFTTLAIPRPHWATDLVI